jgi:HD-GYP domain-containing protein (c-di-GMP phosphodiesterase class II)
MTPIMEAGLTPPMLTIEANPVSAPAQLRMSDLISALSYALDLTEGQPMGHAVKSCLLGMRLAETLGLPVEQQADLYYALLLKDAGCSSNAARMYEILGGDERKAKQEVKATDWTRPTFDGLEYLLRNVMPGKSRLERLFAIAGVAAKRDSQSMELIGTRCDRGAYIARKIGFSEATNQAIYFLDEHWNGKGFPEKRKGEEIPLFSRIMNLCQTLEVFAAMNGVSDAFDVIRERSGSWFDPELVNAAGNLEKEAALWKLLEEEKVRDAVIQMEPLGVFLYADEAKLDNVCEAFADVIDIKSPYTHAHSRGVTRAAVFIAQKLGLPEKEIALVRRSALLHDIGKLSVPNNILDKPGKLTPEEWETIRLHPYYTQRILERISGFQHLAFVASTHHEKLDGSGYFRSLRATQLPMESRAIAVADIYDALSAKRPYRDALPRETVFSIMSKEVPNRLDVDCFEALKSLPA